MGLPYGPTCWYYINHTVKRSGGLREYIHVFVSAVVIVSPLLFCENFAVILILGNFAIVQKIDHNESESNHFGQNSDFDFSLAPSGVGKKEAPLNTAESPN